MKKITLDKNLGPVIFLGGMNAMPMMYALELRKRGIEVLYLVDRPSSDTLSRPENHFKDISYPYPDWIIEWVLISQIFLPMFPKFFAKIIQNRISNRSKKSPQVVFLNGLFCGLSPYFFIGIPKVFLSHGSDLDSWADTNGVGNLVENFSKKSIFKFLPFFVSRKMIRLIVNRQYFGASACSKVVYFPVGFNLAGDIVTNRLKELGVDIISRYDISFEPLKYERRGGLRGCGKTIIFSGVRFLFKTFPDGNRGYNKGNDVIIDGLAKYYALNKNIEIHFVEKGEDVSEAKKLCDELGLSEVIVWHKEMKFIDLLELYCNACVCFDQVGDHWIGAIGFYALWLGVPLIANDQRAIKAGLWGKDSPILSANTAEQIRDHLIYLESDEIKIHLANESMLFADKNLGPDSVLDEIFLYSSV